MNVARRWFVTLLSGVMIAIPLVAAGQQGIPRIAVIAAVTREAQAPFAEAFREGLQKLGYVDGRNVAVEWRYTDGRAERFAEVASELVHRNVDVIVAANNPAVAAVQKATKTIPIVMVYASDPVALGLVASLARPGGNTTGLAGQTPELIAKRLQLLQAAVPRLSRVAVLWDPGFIGIEQQVRESRVAAEGLRIRLQLVGAGTPSEFDAAFAAMTGQAAQATLVLGSSMHYIHRGRIAELAKRHRLPSACLLREFAEAGCLMSYAPNFRELWGRSAVYVDKILKGAKPSDLPIEQPVKFELTINLQTAKSLGLTIPPSLVLRAEQVIE